eukprot:CAMPEP_0118911282 /NCGR_PEP_ID=MMETSP1166-20130328/13044_1 /TAXON_ID=1104430 /ORGANISM="Chrysoreinhardia sp, Strain CCMP3193" /LENGTH=1491 /DNA_ID=CAMNT_0006850763 /DNA_START=64 /DNA_END=4539 /DNA_ORIENTATION=-
MVIPDALKSQIAAMSPLERAELVAFVQDVVSPLLKTEEEEEEEEKGGELWSQPGFLEGSLQATLETEKIVEAVGTVHRKYFNLPAVEVRYKNLTYAAKVDLSEPAIKTVGNQNPLGKILHKIHMSRRAQVTHQDLATEHKILDGCCGVLKPGSLTLVIGAPGCGKSSFLRALCGLLKKKTATTTLDYDECSYNGEDLYDKKKRKFVPSKVATYVEQIDKHVPTLTVEETFRFAQQTFAAGEPLAATEANADLFDLAKSQQKDKAAGGRKRKEAHLVAKDAGFTAEAAKIDEFVQNSSKLKLDGLLRLLGIDHVRSTIVGNAQIRGVSGGQRRRVTVGEMLMGKGRVICGDEISTGLDSQTTYEITRAFKCFAKYMDLTVVLSLLQPPPESFDLFDDVVLLHEGAVAYHGPTEDILTHFKAIHLSPPKRKDVADFLVEITSSEELAATYCDAGAKLVDDFPAAYREFSPHYARMIQDLQVPYESSDKKKKYEWTEFYRVEFTKPLTYYWVACLRRKVLELKYNPAYVKTRFLQAFIMGIFTGTLFYQLTHDEFATKFGLIFSSAMYLALGGMSAIPKKVDDRTVFYKQRDQSFFPTISYALADIIVDSATVLLESLLYVNLVFWPSGLASESYGVFLAVLLVMSLAMNQWFATVAAFAPDAQSGQPLAGMSVLLFVLFSGFIVQRENIPEGWKWLHWLSPIALAFRALAINEFRSDRYDKCVYQVSAFGCDADDPLDNFGCCEESSDGIVFLKTYSVPIERQWVWIAILQLAAYFFLGVFGTCVSLTNVRHVSVAGAGSWIAVHFGESQNAGESQNGEDPTAAEGGGRGRSIILGAGGADDPVAARDLKARVFSKNIRTESQRQIDAASQEAATKDNEIPYTPTTLAFSKLRYKVLVPAKNGGTEDLELLGGVTGFAKPATMTALMGSSGAGKTTLLDVIAQRKTSGTTTGELTLNGYTLDPATFTRISGYCEQLDVHNPASTVYEATAFSAALRLPPAHRAQRPAFVRRLLKLLELEAIADRQTGTIEAGGLTFEERKRLTMAVELATNPAILFLDEPTSGLDSRAAIVVVRATRNIARSGRSVICTIHQPSYALFSVFDRLLLLKRGGQTVYFGDLGPDCATLCGYVSSVARALGTRELEYDLPPGANPATWVLGACVTEDANFALAYAKSDLGKANDAETIEAAKVIPEGYEPPKFSSEYSIAVHRQFPILLQRMVVSYWRGPSYNVARGMVSVVVALIMGSCYSRERPGAVKFYTRVLGRVGLFFLDTFFLGIIFFSSALAQMSIERASYYRERASKMYHPFPYVFSFGIAETPYLVAFSLVHTGLLWATIDFYPGADRFFFYWAYFMLYVSFTTFYAQCLVAALPDQGTAQTLGTAFLTLTSLVSGFSITPNKIPDHWIFTYWISPIHYSLEGMIVTQFNDADLALRDIPGNPSVADFTTSHSSDSHFGGFFTYSHRFQNIIILLVICAVFRTGTLYALTFINYTTR